MQTKKQQLIFKGTDRDGKQFITGSFASCLLNSVTDPIPLNRKSRRSFKKLFKKILDRT